MSADRDETDMKIRDEAWKNCQGPDQHAQRRGYKSHAEHINMKAPRDMAKEKRERAAMKREW